MQGARQMVIIDQIELLLWAAHHREHMPAEKLGAALLGNLMPLGALLSDLPHADRHLCRP